MSKMPSKQRKTKGRQPEDEPEEVVRVPNAIYLVRIPKSLDVRDSLQDKSITLNRFTIPDGLSSGCLPTGTVKASPVQNSRLELVWHPTPENQPKLIPLVRSAKDTSSGSSSDVADALTASREKGTSLKLNPSLSPTAGVITVRRQCIAVPDKLCDPLPKRSILTEPLQPDQKP